MDGLAVCLQQVFRSMSAITMPSVLPMLLTLNLMSTAAAQNIPIANFKRSAVGSKQLWPTTVDIWYSERVVDMDDDVPKWCAPCWCSSSVCRAS